MSLYNVGLLASPSIETPRSPCKPRSPGLGSSRAQVLKLSNRKRNGRRTKVGLLASPSIETRIPTPRSPSSRVGLLASPSIETAPAGRRLKGVNVGLLASPSIETTDAMAAEFASELGSSRAQVLKRAVRCTRCSVLVVGLLASPSIETRYDASSNISLGCWAPREPKY